MARLHSPFRAALAYLYETRFYIYTAFFIFLISGLISFFFPSLFSFLDDTLRHLIDQTAGLSGAELFVFIFQNNLMSAFFALFAGIFLGIVPLCNAALNGAVLGYVVSHAVPVAGWTVLWRLLPHGIFELPAVFIAIGLGIRLGFSFFKRSSLTVVVDRLAGSARVFLYVILPLLFIAALIEAALIVLF